MTTIVLSVAAIAIFICGMATGLWVNHLLDADDEAPSYEKWVNG